MRPVPDPTSVPCRFISTADDLPELDLALRTAERVAIDTETPIDGPHRGELRVMSVATRNADDVEQAFVVDARDVDPTLLAPLLDGVTADAWNASFDARVLDAAVWRSDDTTPGLRWWDAQLADALLHQGRSGVTWFHGLAWATEHYLGLTAEGKGTTQTSFTAFDDLSDIQVRYAAADAVETLWVGDVLRRELAEAELETVAELEMAARPFLDRMERCGLPFDWSSWQAELDAIAAAQRTALGTLAELTGGGQGSLFDDVVEPAWNPASDVQVRSALNRWAKAEVEAWTETRFGAPRLLGDDDSVSAPVLREIGGPLCQAILDHRTHTKILTTYGESIREHLAGDGKLHPQYLQVVGTNTGRLASRNPNAQNFTPRMLPHVRPADPDRVFVHADLSQAELRVLAQIGDDDALRAAFAEGVDVHVTTAASMFGFDADHLRGTDPDQFARYRKVAKALNFGIAYGSGAAALGRTLSTEGNPTTTEEAAELLDRYRATYPGTAAWAQARIAEIEKLRGETDSIDWPVTMRLAKGHRAMHSARRELRGSLGRWPTVDEIAEAHPERHQTDPEALLAELEWLSTYSAPVALHGDGSPFTFASRTVAGRRQQFNLHLDRLLLEAVADAVRSGDPIPVDVRRRFAAEHGLDLSAGPALSSGEIERLFEDRSLRVAYVDALARAVGRTEIRRRLREAASARVGVMVNAWRNAPVQGTVADIMLAAYADLDRRLRSIDGAWPVQTVHDSVVVECRRADAERVAAEIRDAMEQASLRFCPDVQPKADVDVRSTLSDDDVELEL